MNCNFKISIKLRQEISEQDLLKLKYYADKEDYKSVEKLLSSTYYLFCCDLLTNKDDAIKENLFKAACNDGELGVAKILYEPQMYLSGFKAASQTHEMEILEYLILEKFSDLPRIEIEDFLDKSETNFKHDIQWMIKSQVERAMLDQELGTSKKKKTNKL